MAKEHATPRVPNGKRTITLPITEEQYEKIIDDPQRFRSEWLDPFYADCPELFPEGFEKGYEMNGHYTSARQHVKIRRVMLRNGDQYQIRPSFVMPMMVARTEDVEAGLFLRKFGVPYWAIVRLFGRNTTFWYRLETGIGRNSIVGTTVKTVSVPKDILADEHHETICGEKAYIATTVAEGVFLGAEVLRGASKEELKEAYGVFKAEAEEVEPNYAPKTVNTDGWSGTIGAWSMLFVNIVLIRCFLHAWLRIRERSKNLKEQFFEIGKRVWEVYYSATRRVMSRRIRRLRDWAEKNLSGVVQEKVLDLCNKKEEWSLWYEGGCEQAHTTSNMLDRLMRQQNGYFDRGQHFHGDLRSSNLRSRSWAILYNYWPWSPASVVANQGSRCPAERLNGKRYSDCWLSNLLVATSLGGTKKLPLKIRNN
jgi:hypothetical protein